MQPTHAAPRVGTSRSSGVSYGIVRGRFRRQVNVA
jgi:hypothetical protein